MCTVRSCEVCGYLIHADVPAEVCTECGSPLALADVQLTTRLTPCRIEAGRTDGRVLLFRNATSACQRHAKFLVLISAVVALVAALVCESVYLRFEHPTEKYAAEAADWLNSGWSTLQFGSASATPSVFLHRTPPPRLGVLKYRWLHWRVLVRVGLWFFGPVACIYLITFLALRCFILPPIGKASTFARLNLTAVRLAAVSGSACAVALFGVAGFAAMRLLWMVAGIEQVYQPAYYVLLCAFVLSIVLLFVSLIRFLSWLDLSNFRKFLTVALSVTVSSAAMSYIVVKLGVISGVLPLPWFTLGRSNVEWM